MKSLNAITGKVDGAKLVSYITFNLSAFKKQNCDISTAWKAGNYSKAGALSFLLKKASAK